MDLWVNGSWGLVRLACFSIDESRYQQRWLTKYAGCLEYSMVGGKVGVSGPLLERGPAAWV